MTRRITPHKGGRTASAPRARIRPQTLAAIRTTMQRREKSFADLLEEEYGGNTMSKINKMVNDFEIAKNRGANLDAGKARRKLIAEARANGTAGWPKDAINIVTDERGNLLPAGGYSDEA